ncbi:MAG TPA: FAD-binding protein, partial [candidate division Zixibacteria bacterium]|nr:FAD-binding protein [candidate division Zixibacteria bacterium]
MTFRLPENLSSSDGATVEPLAVGLHAVDVAGVRSGEDVLIVGAGPVGLACAIWAKILGAREVVVSDYAAHRRDMALAYGATAAIDPAKDVEVVYKWIAEQFRAWAAAAARLPPN